MILSPKRNKDEVAAWKGVPAIWRVEVGLPAGLKSPPAFQVWNPVHVGMMAWESAGAASERRKVFAVPLTAARPIVAEGFAPVELAYLFPLTSLSVVTVRFVPVAFVKVKFVRVEEADHSWVEDAPAVSNWWSPVQTGVRETLKAGAASDRMKVRAVPFTAESPTEAEGFAPVEDAVQSAPEPTTFPTAFTRRHCEAVT
jgi:hypothetical protein